MLKAILGCASHMEVVAVASTQTVLRGLKEAPSFASPMVEARGACLMAVPEVQRAVHPSAKGMVAGRGASLREVGCAQRVSMVELASVLHMEGANAAPFLGALRAPVVALIAV